MGLSTFNLNFSSGFIFSQVSYKASASVTVECHHPLALVAHQWHCNRQPITECQTGALTSRHGKSWQFELPEHFIHWPGRGLSPGCSGVGTLGFGPRQ